MTEEARQVLFPQQKLLRPTYPKKPLLNRHQTLPSSQKPPSFPNLLDYTNSTGTHPSNGIKQVVPGLGLESQIFMDS